MLAQELQTTGHAAVYLHSGRSGTIGGGAVSNLNQHEHVQQTAERRDRGRVTFARRRHNVVHDLYHCLMQSVQQTIDVIEGVVRKRTHRDVASRHGSHRLHKASLVRQGTASCRKRPNITAQKHQ
jgi:hypothetical protein